MAATVREIDPPIAPAPESVDVDVLILPREIEDGVGLYDDSALTLAKDLREAGVTAEYQHPADARGWIGERGADILIAFIVGIASNAAWSAISGLLRRQHAADSVRVRVSRIRDRKSNRDWEWFELEGTGDEVADALESLRPGDGEEQAD